jgi:hypothetical protein
VKIARVLVIALFTLLASVLGASPGAAAPEGQVMFAPIWLIAGLSGIGPRVEEPGIGLIAGYAFSAPFEDIG